MAALHKAYAEFARAACRPPPFRDTVLSPRPFLPGSIPSSKRISILAGATSARRLESGGDQLRAPAEISVQADSFEVADKAALLCAELRAAVAVCIHDDTQGVGGMLHLRYVATRNEKPLELTDNTLSSDVLLLDRFCKELRACGARKQSWQVRLIAHIPETPAVSAPAATVLDLLKAYFIDSRQPLECREIRRLAGVLVRLEAREGQLWVTGASEVARVRAPRSAVTAA
jgi:hypothetical protein